MNETRGLMERGVALAAAALLALPAVSLAQGMAGHHQPASGQQGPMGPGYGMMGSGMMGGMGMMMGPAPRSILAQKDALGLSDEQVARLDSLQAQATEAWQSHYAMMQGIHQQVGELQQSEKPDLDRYQNLMQQMASSGAAMHVRIAKLGQEALGVLTPDQRSKVRYGMGFMGQSGGMGGMMGRGMMGGGSGMGMMGSGSMMGPGSTSTGMPCGTGSAGPAS